MPTVKLSPIFNGWQGFTPTGLPLSGGFVYTYLAGTAAPATTYTTTLGTVANSNPIALLADGRPPAEIWLAAGSAYKFILTTAALVPIGTYDDIIGIGDANNFIATGNTVLGTTGNTLDVSNGAITVASGNTSIGGNLTVAGTTTLNGNTAIGNAGADTLVIAPSAVTWTNNPTHSGAHTWTGAQTYGSNVTVTRSDATAVTDSVTNTNATAGDAKLALSVGGTAAGDPGMTMAVTGGSTWSVGVDNNINDTFCVSLSSSPGSNDLFTITTTGVATHTSNSAANEALRVTNTNAAPVAGIVVGYTTDPNSTTAAFLRCFGLATLRAEIRSNGGFANFSANDVNLSDARLKHNIQPAKSYWDALKAMEFVTFLYNNQDDTRSNLGIIAGQLRTVAPELVDEDGFGEVPEDGRPLLSVYQTDFQYATARALQEAMNRIEKLESLVKPNDTVTE